MKYTRFQGVTAALLLGAKTLRAAGEVGGHWISAREGTGHASTTVHGQSPATPTANY